MNLVNKCLTKYDDIDVYGIFQNPYTKDHIIVLGYVGGGNFCCWINKYYNNFDMGLCEEVSYTNEQNIYGIMP
ncbi:kinase-like domain-containing protein [Rhizophagus clarus]|uniref:Kinase-like domain-containing protein n=1 Tax=Rhizophagus clarus TaxID=94130 RepID=A0A8H3LWY1_9GLOM|nr:kinase-like domain-containing protein [Rhizophagus clarus]